MHNVLQTWLFHQCQMLSGAVAAVLLTGISHRGSFDKAVFWPEKPSRTAVLSRVAQAAAHNRKTVIKTRSSKIEKTGEPLDAIAIPLIVDEALLGVVAIEAIHRTQPMQQALVKQVQDGSGWLETILHLHGATAREQLVHLVEMVAVGLESEHFKVAAAEVTNELAERFSCRRVSLGFLHRQRVRIEAVSHCNRIDRQSKEIQALRDAQLESLDQGTTIVYPPPADAPHLVTRFHERLANARNGAAICSLPLVKNGRTVGALLLERAPDQPFDAETTAQCEQIGLLLGPLLETRRRDERPLPSKIIDALRSASSAMLGPRHLPLKLTGVLTGALLVWLCLTGTMFRIACDSELEARICRVIAAPQQGYIATAHARAGDLVRQGDLLATLDDKELKLERRRWQSQRAQLLKEYRQALAGFNRAEVAIIKAKRAQAEAQLQLIEQQLTRTTLKAPFSGLVVEGDLSQALGSPVTRGEVLFQVAPTDEYRVVLKVDDRDIGLIQAGQRGQLKLSGIPDQRIDITIDRITPVSSSAAGRTYFRVEGTMARHSDLMRPGMKGIAKIEIGPSKLIWTWTRRLVNWLRLFAWSRIP